MTVLTDRQSFSRGVLAAVRSASFEGLARAKAFASTLTRRKAIYDLSRLDDRMLSDMGITRADLAEASRWSLWGDPTDRLAEVAQERRASRSQELGVG